MDRHIYQKVMDGRQVPKYFGNLESIREETTSSMSNNKDNGRTTIFHWKSLFYISTTFHRQFPSSTWDQPNLSQVKERIARKKTPNIPPAPEQPANQSPTLLNAKADTLRCIPICLIEWELPQDTFNKLTEVSGPLQKHLMANKKNKKLLWYISPTLETSSLCQYSTAWDWNKWTQIYLFPPK